MIVLVLATILDRQLSWVPTDDLGGPLLLRLQQLCQRTRGTDAKQSAPRKAMAEALRATGLTAAA